MNKESEKIDLILEGIGILMEFSPTVPQSISMMFREYLKEVKEDGN